MWRNWNQLLVGLWNSATTVGNSTVALLKIIKRITVQSRNLTSWNTSKRTESRDSERFIQPMLTAATMHSNQEAETTQMSVRSEWINEAWYTHATECHLPLQNRVNPVKSYSMSEPWVYIILSEISQKIKDCMIPLIWGMESSQIHTNRKRNYGY